MSLGKSATARGVVLEERINQKVAHWLTTLTIDDLRKYNPSSPTHHCKDDKDFERGLNKLKVMSPECLLQAVY